MEWLSRPFAALYESIRDAPSLRADSGASTEATFDLIIIGSGYGGSVVAARVAEQFAERERASGRAGRPRIAVLERGQEFVPGEFPNDLGTVFEEVRIDNWDSDSPTGNADALFNFIRGRDVTAVVGQALGGGSQINASVAIRAPQDMLAGWADDLTAARENGRASYYTRAERMLLPAQTAAVSGVPRYDKDEAFERVFTRSAHQPSKAQPAPIAVHFAYARESAPGIAVEAQACNGCGNCVTGCNYGAKNTLTQNYLPLAYREGVELYTRASVEKFAHDDAPAVSHPWEVSVFPAQFEKSALEAYRVRLRTRVLVLCAGTIGSTELLMRSAQAQPQALSFSLQLGRRVSGNGDSLSFSFWEKEPVHAAGWDSPDCPDNVAGTAGARTTSPLPTQAPGPTITSMFEASPMSHGQPSQKLLVENGVVPGAIARLVAEFTNTSAFTHDLTDELWQAQRQGVAGGDGAATFDEARTHTQTFLTMCDDGAPYVLAPGQSREDKDPAAPSPDPSRPRNFRRAFIHRPDFAPQFQEDSDAWLERVLTTHADGSARADGVMVSNPGYSPISSKLRKLLSGAQPGGGVVTVHPLGGCAIGATVENGVVDSSFRVFRRPAATVATSVDSREVYAGLYVCDGAVFPRAIGVNPFLTIAALAERCSEDVVADLAARGVDFKGPGAQPLPIRAYRPVFHRQPGETRIRFSERLSTPLTHGNAEGARNGEAFDRGQVDQLEPLFFEPAQITPNRRFADRIEAHLRRHYQLPLPAMPLVGQSGLRIRPEQHDFRGLSIPPVLALEVNWAITDIAGFLRGERSIRIGEQGGQHRPELSASLSIEFDESTLLPRSERVQRGEVLRALSGEVSMFVPLPAGRARRRLQKYRALWHWCGLRGLKELSYEFTKPYLDRSKQTSEGVVAAVKRLWKQRAGVSLNYAARAGSERCFAYQFTFLGKDGEHYLMRGQKLVTFRSDVNPWNAIGQIPQATITRVRNCETIWRGILRFDLREFAKRLTPEVLEAPHLLAGIESVLQYGLFTARVMLQHSLWHFKMPEYKASIPRQWEWPGEWRGLHRETFDVPVPAQLDSDRASGQWRFAEAEDSFIRLTRYQNERLANSPGQAGRSKGAILMYHGLLHSAVCFTTRFLRDRHNETIPVADLSLDASNAQNMVEFFCARGYECWTVDMRVSTANEQRKRKWTLDEVARWDVPASVRFVNDHIRARALPADAEPPVFVFAHCMGAAVFSMASLSGLVLPRGAKASHPIAGHIDGLVLCQFGPFMVPSDSNLGRTAAVQLGRDFMAIDNYNPIEDADSTRDRRPLRDREAMFDAPAAAVLFDRLASSYPLSDDERAGHHMTWLTPLADQQICNRLSLMIGENFVHENLASGSHRNLEEFIGPTRIETFWQTLYFGVKGRVVDYEGRNVYVNDFGDEDRTGTLEEAQGIGFSKGFDFPILFLHGEKNGLFHPRSTFLAMQHLRRIKQAAGVPNVEQRYQYYKVDGYGHLENVLGKDAYRTVFPAVERFFDSVRPGAAP